MGVNVHIINLLAVTLFEKMAKIKVKMPDSMLDFRIIAFKGMKKYLFGG